MGHNRLLVLPKSKDWQHVVGLLEAHASTPEIVARSAKAAETAFMRGTGDPALGEAVRLLLCIPSAARSPDFGEALRRLGLHVQGRPNLTDVLIAISEHQDETLMATPVPTDLGELAGRALYKTLEEMVGAELPGLFAPTQEDFQAVMKKFSSSRGIAALTRAFFGSLLADTLSYWLDRELALHIGPQRRFATVSEKSLFDAEMHQLVAETTRIIQEFAGGWHGKRMSEGGTISSQDASRFSAFCIKKILSELRQRVPQDG